MENQYNLLDEPWINVICLDGEIRCYGIQDCLLNAHIIVDIEEDNHLFKYGIYRFLIALITDVFHIYDIDTLIELFQLNKFSKSIIDQYCEKFYSNFFLFSYTTPFYQNPELLKNKKKNIKSIIELLCFFFPKGDNTVFYWNKLQNEHSFSPKVCAKALCSLPAFAVGGGAGLSPSINGKPPWYFLIKNETFFKTLVLNCCGIPNELNKESEVPIWRSNNEFNFNNENIFKFKPHLWKEVNGRRITNISVAQGLSWMTRDICLLPSEGGICTYSGEESDILVPNLIKNSGRRNFRGVWSDPHVIYHRPASEKEPDILIEKGFQPFNLKILSEAKIEKLGEEYLHSHKAYSKKSILKFLPLTPSLYYNLWRDIAPLMILPFIDKNLFEKTEYKLPKTIQQFHLINKKESLLLSTYPLIIEIFGLLTNKATFLDWFHDTLSLHSNIINNSFKCNLLHLMFYMINKTERFLDKSIYSFYTALRLKTSTFQNLKRKVSFDFWNRLELIFKKDFLLILQNQNKLDDSKKFLDDWKLILKNTGKEILENNLQKIGSFSRTIRHQLKSIHSFSSNIHFLKIPSLQNSE